MFGIRAGDELTIGVDGSAILLRKLEVRCVFCDGLDGLREFRGKQLCRGCDTLLQGASSGSEDLRGGETQGDLVDPSLGHSELGGDSSES